MAACGRPGRHTLYVVPAVWREDARHSGKLAPYILVYVLCDPCAEDALRVIGADATGAATWEGVNHYPRGERVPGLFETSLPGTTPDPAGRNAWRRWERSPGAAAADRG